MPALESWRCTQRRDSSQGCLIDQKGVRAFMMGVTCLDCRDKPRGSEAQPDAVGNEQNGLPHPRATWRKTARAATTNIHGMEILH
jgi:hypothetical protein